MHNYYILIERNITPNYWALTWKGYFYLNVDDTSKHFLCYKLAHISSLMARVILSCLTQDINLDLYIIWQNYFQFNFGRVWKKILLSRTKPASLQWPPESCDVTFHKKILISFPNNIFFCSYSTILFLDNYT